VVACVWCGLWCLRGVQGVPPWSVQTSPLSLPLLLPLVKCSHAQLVDAHCSPTPPCNPAPLLQPSSPLAHPRPTPSRGYTPTSHPRQGLGPLLWRCPRPFPPWCTLVHCTVECAGRGTTAGGQGRGAWGLPSVHCAVGYPCGDAPGRPPCAATDPTGSGGGWRQPPLAVLL
jgi:hypothetical protein